MNVAISNKLWVDDLRADPDTEHAAYSTPEGWTWARTNADAIALLQDPSHSWEVISLDYGMGFHDTTRPIVEWLMENQKWPKVIEIHSANPEGRIWLRRVLSHAAPEGVEIR